MSTLYLHREAAAADQQQQELEQFEQNFIAYGFICNFYLFITSLIKLP
jgi:hypothetical protein